MKKLTELKEKVNKQIKKKKEKVDKIEGAIGNDLEDRVKTLLCVPDQVKSDTDPDK